MKRSHGLVAIVGLLAIGTGAGLYRAVRTTELASASPAGDRTGESSPAARGFTPQAAELIALRQELAVLKQQVRSQEHRLDAVGEAPPAQSDAVAEVVTPAEQERRSREYMAGVASSFRNEPLDSAWSAAKTSLVQTALAADPALRQRVRSVECRSQTCRVELDDDAAGRPNGAVQTFLSALGRELPSTLAERVEQPGRPASTVLYVGHHADMQVTVQ